MMEKTFLKINHWVYSASKNFHQRKNIHLNALDRVGRHNMSMDQQERGSMQATKYKKVHKNLGRRKKTL